MANGPVACRDTTRRSYRLAGGVKLSLARKCPGGAGATVGQCPSSEEDWGGQCPSDWTRRAPPGAHSTRVQRYDNYFSALYDAILSDFELRRAVGEI
jgi:hypothetical protein